MKYRIIKYISILIITGSLLLPIKVKAKKTGIGDECPQLMRGVRPLGMGNAFITMPGTDSIAPFYNPAAINDYTEKRQYAIGAPMAEFDPGFFPIIEDLLNLRDELHGSDTSSQKIHFFRNFTERNVGKYNHFATSMSLFQVMHKKYFAAVVADNRDVISLRDEAFPNFEFKTGTSAGVVGGSAMGFFDDSLQIGGNLKILYRMGIEDQITTGDILVYSIKELIGFGAWKKGFGVGIDGGFKYRLPLLKKSLKPTIAITIQDIGDTWFTNDAPKLPMSISVGAGIFPKIGNVDLAMLMDLRELNQQMHFLSKFHL